MLRIGDFSKLARISIRMLRHYDEINLLKPDEIDVDTGYRYYSVQQLPLAVRISSLREMGFGLQAVSEILKAYDKPEILEACLKRQYQQTIDQTNIYAYRLRLLETALARIGEDESIMRYDVTLKILPERYVASVRQVIPAYQEEGMLWTIFMQETAALGLQFANPSYGMAIFHDGEFKEQNVDVEIQQTVLGQYTDTEHVRFKQVPAVQIASATYQGGYEKISEVNAAVARWIADNGYQHAGVNFCIYHVGPNDSKNPADWVTEVCYPVKK